MWRTEEEAGKASCPAFVVALIISQNCGLAKNASPMQLEAISRCVGSECMLWRQNIITENNETQMKGFCGLAGVPPR